MTPSPSSITFDKALATLTARLALAGGELTVETGIDGRTRYFVEVHGRVYPFDDIGQAEILVGLIEGAL